MHVFLLFPNYKAFIKGYNEPHDDHYHHDDSHDLHPYDHDSNVHDETNHFTDVNVEKPLLFDYILYM